MRIRQFREWRREGPRPELALVAWAAFTVAYLLFRNHCGPTLNESALGAYWWLPPAAFACLAWLHHRTAGRTSPAAALAFVIVGPVLGVCLLVPQAVKERFRFETAGVVHPVGPQEALASIHMFGCIALLAAAVVALVHAALTYREWSAAYIMFRPPLPMIPIDEHAPFFLAELGLDRSSSLDDLDREYRHRARDVHPDRGGTDADFKRLHTIYEMAREYLSKRRRPVERAAAECVESPQP